MKDRSYAAVALAALVVLAACSNAAVPGSGGANPSLAAGSLAQASMSSIDLAAIAASSINLAALPLDDGHYTTAGPRRGWVYTCQSTFKGRVPRSDGPWIDTATGTWDSLTKPKVEGDVAWNSHLKITVNGSKRTIVGNGLPAQGTGTFPIAPSDPVYQYDHNPNAIQAQAVRYVLPSYPTLAKTASCVNMGPIGIMLTGAQLFNALDAAGHDAAAHEVLDRCNAHPDQSGTYHYHALSPCMNDAGKGHSPLLGYAADGFGIYGPRGENGKILTDADLDACHGHTHKILWNGKWVVMYHYHMTYDYPYSIGCYRGTPTVRGPHG